MESTHDLVDAHVLALLRNAETRLVRDHQLVGGHSASEMYVMLHLNHLPAPDFLLRPSKLALPYKDRDYIATVAGTSRCQSEPQFDAHLTCPEAIHVLHKHIAPVAVRRNLS